MIDLYRVDKIKLLVKAKNDFEILMENIDKAYKTPGYNRHLCEEIITTINAVWQKENERIKLLESCEEKEEVLKVVTEEEEQIKDSLKEEDLNLLK